MTTEAQVLARLAPGSVTAAAGCGKTELIARAVAVSGSRQLVLTHTNAGVEALRRRLRRCGARPSLVAVDTIAGWCLKYVLAYPGRSGGLPLAADGQADWKALYPAMTRILRDGVIRRVLAESYSGALIDEYQDCDRIQHALVLALADVIPVRVLGDPLQSVFRFSGDPPDWATEVEVAFPRVATLVTPWRWRRPNENVELGDWLTSVRAVLERGDSVALTDAPVKWIKPITQGRWAESAQAECFQHAVHQQTVAAVFKWPSEFRRSAMMTGGLFQAVEPIDARDAAVFLESLEGATDQDRPREILGFVRSIAAGGDVLDRVDEAYLAGEAGEAVGSVGAALRALRECAVSPVPTLAADALDQVARLKGVKVYRRELLWAAIDSLRDESVYGDMVAALRKRRNHTSHVGRRLARCSAGSTLLLKGMEFDHALVVDTGKFTVQDLYVALTRGSKSLAIVAADARLRGT